MEQNQKIRLVMETLQVWTLFLNFGISIVLLLWRYGKIRTSFETPLSKNAAASWLEKPSEYRQTFLKNSVFQLSYRIKNIQASHTNNIHTGEKICCFCYIWRFAGPFFSERM